MRDVQKILCTQEKPGRYSCTVNAQVHVCGHCGKVFKSRGSLQDHARSHDDSLSYPCNKFFVRFRYRNELRHHSEKCLSYLLHYHKPPGSRLLALGVFKPSCSTPFTLFLRLVSVYRPFQLYFIPKLSTIPPFSAPFLQLM